VVLRESPSKTTALSLTDGSWRWVSAELNGSELKPNKPEAFVLTLSTDARFASSTDCNQLVGSYTVDGANLTFGQIASTMMYCEGSQEGEYSALLAETSSYKIKDTMLTLQLKDNKGTMQFAHISASY
jgi:heat shock protein HslJ